MIAVLRLVPIILLSSFIVLVVARRILFASMPFAPFRTVIALTVVAFPALKREACHLCVADVAEFVPWFMYSRIRERVVLTFNRAFGTVI